MEVIYDFETMGSIVESVAVVNVAGMEFDSNRFTTNPYTYEELLDMTKFLKFDIMEQVEKYGRKIEKRGIEFWKKQSPEVQKQIKPSDEDVSITKLPSFMFDDLNILNAKKIWTRGNTFDPILVRSLFRGPLGIDDIQNWWAIRDVRSYIEGFTYGTQISHMFYPKELDDVFVAHDPIHDISMDVYRMQYLVRTVYGED